MAKQTPTVIVMADTLLTLQGDGTWAGDFGDADLLDQFNELYSVEEVRRMQGLGPDTPNEEAAVARYVSDRVGAIIISVRPVDYVEGRVY